MIHDWQQISAEVVKSEKKKTFVFDLKAIL